MGALTSGSPIRITRPTNILRLRSYVALSAFVFFLFLILCKSNVSPRQQYDSWLGLHPLNSSEYDSQHPSQSSSGWTPYTTSQSSSEATSIIYDDSTPPPVHCSELPGANDVLLVMKTGATEVSDKVPVHLDTTFACAPNHLVFSDMAEDFMGIKIHNSLDTLGEYIDKDRSPDEWKFYNKLQDLSKSLPNRTVFEQLGQEGADDAWKLDKFKNQPMLQKAYDMHPNKKWYVFIDADTSVVWSTLLTWLNKLDHKKVYYLGSQALISDIEFGHGGSGYVLSSAAVKILVNEEKKQKHDHWKWASETCCGDFTIAIALRDHQVPLTHAWPMIQGETPSTLDFGDSHWCWPAVTFHHVSPEEVEMIWNWDQQHLRSGDKRVPTYADVFSQFVTPNITDERDGWDNMSMDETIEKKDKKEQMGERERLATESWEGCREACLDDRNCFQFSFDKKDGKCGLGRKMRLGEKKKNVKSGWNVARIEKYQREHEKCKTEWITG